MSDIKRLLSGAYIIGYSDARNDKAIDPIGAIERLTMNMNKNYVNAKRTEVDNLIKKIKQLEPLNNTDCPEWVINVIRGMINETLYDDHKG